MKFALVVGLSLALMGVAKSQEQTLTAVDRPIPDFSLQGVDGTVYNTKNLQGKTWLINFWAVWCAPCLEELPALNNAWAQLKEQNVGMLAINIGEEADAIETFLTENNLTIDFPIVVGDKIRSLGNWSGRALPHTVVVAPNGRVVYEAAGAREWDEQRYIDAVVALNETKGSAPESSKISASIAQFHNFSTTMKSIIVATLLFLVIALLYLIRKLSRKSSSK